MKGRIAGSDGSEPGTWKEAECGGLGSWALRDGEAMTRSGAPAGGGE